MQLAQGNIEPGAVQRQFLAVFLYPHPGKGAQTGERVFDRCQFDAVLVGFGIAWPIALDGARHILDGAHPATDEIRVAEGTALFDRRADAAAAAMYMMTMCLTPMERTANSRAALVAW